LEIQTPKLEIQAPKLEIQTPKLEVQTPKLEVQAGNDEPNRRAMPAAVAYQAFSP
jgi:hypothetical protein